MATLTPIQQTFLGGEISPRVRGQVGSDLYEAALALAQDFRVTPQGSLLKRSGSRFVVEGWAGALRHIPSPGRRGYLLNFGDETVACFCADSLYPNAGNALWSLGRADFEAVTNGVFAGGSAIGNGDYTLPADWTTVAGAVVTRNTWIAGAPARAAVFPVGGGTIRQAIAALETGPLEAGLHSLRFTLATYHANTIPDAQAAALTNGTTLNVRVGTTEGGTELLDFEVSASVAGWNGYADAHYRFDVTTEVAATIYVEIETSGPAGITGISLHTPTGYALPTTPWTAAQLAEIQTAPLQDVEGIVVVHPNVAPYKVWLDVYGVWHCDAISFTGTPTEWGVANYPSVVEVFQGRLWLAGCASPADKFWGSKINDIDDLSLGDGNATDGLAYQLQARAGIRWMRGIQGTLFMGTEVSEHAVRSQAGVICTTDVQVTEESSFGSAAIPAKLVGGRLLYVSGDGRKLRGLMFTQERQAWASENMIATAEHLTSGNAIEEVADVREPDDVIALRLADGTMACCTFVPGQAAAWWRLELGGAATTIEAIVAIPGDPTQLWMLVKRGTDYLLEVLTFGAQEDEEYLDCWVRKALVASDALTGLPVPTGQHVSVVVGGALVQTLVATSGGAATLAQAYTSSDVVAGCAYTATATTLPVEAGSRRGTSQGTKRRWPKIQARLANSAMPTIAGELPPGTAATLADQDVVVNTLGHDSQGQITIAQALPYRTEILALFGVLHGGEV